MAYQWINKLDTIIICWIVASSDHDPNSLTIELATSQTSEKSDAEDNRVKEVSATGI